MVILRIVPIHPNSTIIMATIVPDRKKQAGKIYKLIITDIYTKNPLTDRVMEGV